MAIARGLMEMKTIEVSEIIQAQKAKGHVFSLTHRFLIHAYTN